VDGGNSNFRDSKRRYIEAKHRGIHFVDAGVSGGVWGLEVGFCLMVGGDDEPGEATRADLSTRSRRRRGTRTSGPPEPAFVKMVHNGIGVRPDAVGTPRAS